MGEYVWTSIAIGGKAKKEVWNELEKLLDSHFDEVTAGLNPKDPTCITAAGNCNYGNADEIEEFCQENNLTYQLSWAAQPGAFDAGIHYWQPGMKSAGEAEANDDEEPVMSLQTLQRRRTERKTLDDIIAELEKASFRAVPPAEIEPETVSA